VEEEKEVCIPILTPFSTPQSVSFTFAIYCDNLSLSNKELLRYGPERGSEAALKALAAFLNANVGYRYHDYSPGQSSAPLNQSHQSQNQNEIVKSDHLMITGGCSIV